MMAILCLMDLESENLRFVAAPARNARELFLGQLKGEAGESSRTYNDMRMYSVKCKLPSLSRAAKGASQKKNAA